MKNLERFDSFLKVLGLSSKNANSKRAKRLSRVEGGERARRWANRIPPCRREGRRRNISLLFIVSKLFLPLITVDDWTGQDSLAEEFPLSGRNTEYRLRPLKFNVFGAPIVLSDPLESYPLSPWKNRPWFFFPPSLSSLSFSLSLRSFH